MAAKVVQRKKLSEDIPLSIGDGVGNLKSISGRLRVLVAAAEGGNCDYYELSGFGEITQNTLGTIIEELDGIVANIEKDFKMNLWG